MSGPTPPIQPRPIDRRDALVAGGLGAACLEELQRRHPSDPWPACDLASDEGRIACARAAVEALGASRPVVATWSVRAAPYLEAAPTGSARGAMPHGLVVDLLPAGTPVDVGAEAGPIGSLFERAMVRVLPLPARFDDDSATLYFQYALALSENADMFARAGRGDVAARLSRWIILLKADELHERVRDAMRAIGRAVPPASLEARAKELAEGR